MNTLARCFKFRPTPALAAALLCCGGLGASQAQTILVDHSSRGAAPTLGGTWNQIAGTLANTPPAGIKPLVDSTGAATSVSLSYSGIFSANSVQNAWTAGDQGWVDADATLDFFASDNGSVVTLLFTGLTPGGAYKVDHVAARETSGTGRLADYTIGGNFADSSPNGDNFNAQLNGFNSGFVLTWNTAFADVGGNLRLIATPVGSSDSAYFSATRLSVAANPVPEPEAYALMLMGLATVWAARRRTRAARRSA